MVDPRAGESKEKSLVACELTFEVCERAELVELVVVVREPILRRGAVGKDG
jgi:hypothetical protein